MIEQPASVEQDAPKLEANRDQGQDWGMAIFLALATVVMVGLVFLPGILRAVSESPRVEALGKVQRVNYLGGLGTWTQVELPGKTLLLHRSVELDVGMEVERRTGLFSDQLCVPAGNRCFEIASR